MTRGPSVKPSDVAVVGGTGKLGFALALRMAHAGMAVTIGSRDQGRGEAAAKRAAAHILRGKIAGASNVGAIGTADVVIVAVPFAAQLLTLRNVREAWLPGQVAIDTCVPLATVLGGKPTHLVHVWQGSAAEQARRAIPAAVGVVSAFHTVSAERLGNLAEALDEDVLVCGDNPEDNSRVCSMIEHLEGLRPVDCGALELSRLTEARTPLLIAINKTRPAPSGIRITSPAKAPTASVADARDLIDHSGSANA